MPNVLLTLQLAPLVAAIALLMAGVDRFRWLVHLYVLQSLLVALGTPRALLPPGPVLAFAVLTLVLKCVLAPRILRRLRDRYPPRPGGTASRAGLAVAAALAAVPAATVATGAEPAPMAACFATLLVGAFLAGRRVDPLLQLMGVLVVDNAVALAIVTGPAPTLAIVTTVTVEISLAAIVLLLDRSLLGDALFADTSRSSDFEDLR